LAALENLWGRREYLRPQIAGRSQEQRQQLIANIDFNKCERWAYTRMINVSQGEKIIMKSYGHNIQLDPYGARVSSCFNCNTLS
jgi:hypothetical protein